MRDIMVDLETLGSTPGCAILSIGAVAFDDRDISEDVWELIVDRASCKAAGLHECPETLSWWDKQSTAARQTVAFASEPDIATPLTEVLTDFNRYLSEYGEDVRLWGNGSDFDNAILAAAYRATNIKPKWKFWNNRCYRTLKNMHPEVPLHRTGTHHRAIDDAVSQAIHASAILAHRGAV